MMKSSSLGVCFLLLLALLGLLITLPYQTTARRLRGLRPVSEQYTPEPVHSLVPGTATQTYYNIGGSAVLTNKGVRLTPAVSGRTGWMWNEYPIESENFEVEMKFEIFSKPHYGGDGFGIFFVEGNTDPSFYTDPTAINGSVMGMNENFKGVGVIIDVYDNDGRRNNPAIFAIKNLDGKQFQFRPDQDFEGSMITDLHRGSHRCVNDLRNTNRPVELVLKVIKNTLFVYINSHASTGYRSCLSVQLNLGTDSLGHERTLKGNHLAVTAQTGQVSDNIDIHSINVRYLKATDAIDTTELDDLAAQGSFDAIGFVMNIVVVGMAVYLFTMTVQDYQAYRSALQSQVTQTIVAQKLNQTVFTQFYLTLALAVGTLFTLKLLPFLLILVLALLRILFYTKHLLAISPQMVPHQSTLYGQQQQISGGGNGLLGMSLQTRYYLALATTGGAMLFLLADFFFGFTLF